jgi:hypothetical protein
MNDQQENLGQAIDRVQNLAFSLNLPYEAKLHHEAMIQSLPEVVKELKEAFVELTGENPWGIQITGEYNKR